MNIKLGICKKCGKEGQVNSRQLCSDCVFKESHGGESRIEVYSKRREIKRFNEVKIKVNGIYDYQKKPRKKRLNLLKKEKLDKRKEILRKDEETYEAVFNSRPNKCEECGAWLPPMFRDDEGHIVARHQYSHIISKGADGEFRHNSKNFNRLCQLHHYIWEFGDRKSMKIYEGNQIIIQQLHNGQDRVYVQKT